MFDGLKGGTVKEFGLIFGIRGVKDEVEVRWRSRELKEARNDVYEGGEI